MTFHFFVICDVSALQTASLEHEVVISQNVTAIESKADQAITFDLHELTLKMKEVEETKKKDEDYGLGVSSYMLCCVVLC